MTEAIKITTHETDAILRLIEQYKHSENMQSIIKIFAHQTQDIEDVLFGLFGRLKIKDITGKSLDKLGEIIGQERLGFSDDIYRILLYTRIAINISGGTPENLISVFKILTQATEIDFRELYPAAIQISSDANPDPSLLGYIKNAIETTLPAGVKLSLVSYYDVEASFGFDDGLGSFDTDHGFGDITNPAIGGELGKVL